MSKFWKVKCGNCGNKLFVYSNATSRVFCGSCNAQISEPSGGEARLLEGMVAEKVIG